MSLIRGFLVFYNLDRSACHFPEDCIYHFWVPYHMMTLQELYIS